MADYFVAEIRMFACNFAPTGWAFCDGQILPISQNTALFSLLGTRYGGDGKSTFALPNLQGKAALQAGQGQGLSQYDEGQEGGENYVTLISSEMPAHNHVAKGSSDDGVNPSPANHTWSGAGADLDLFWYNPATSGGTTIMAPDASGFAGGSQPHNNLMPYLVVNFCIALQGVFPARS